MYTIHDLMRHSKAGINFEPEALCSDLVAYGEPDAATAIETMPLDQLFLIKELALKRLSGGGLISRAICLAAIEVLEGAPRPLRRKRRVYAK